MSFNDLILGEKSIKKIISTRLFLNLVTGTIPSCEKWSDLNSINSESPFGKKKIIYADWTASGRAYQPIEECIQKEIMPFVANTHTETTITGKLMLGVKVSDLAGGLG